jgi:hypothetical protein
MRENPLICVEADEVRGQDDWASVVILGQYVEIPNAREYAKAGARPLPPAIEIIVVAERIYGIPDSPRGQTPGPYVLLY